MSLGNKPIGQVWKGIIRVDDDANGLGTSLKAITDGEGTASSVSLSDDQLSVKPENDDTTAVFRVLDKDGNVLFYVDSTNDTVKALGHNLNSQYAYFGICGNDATWAGCLANTHYMVPFSSANSAFLVSDIANLGLGTSTDPATSLTISTDASDIIQCYWFIEDNITIDSVTWWVAGDAATGDTVRAHLMSYDVVTSAGSTGGDLSSGAVIASSADITSAGYEQAYKNTMTVSSADVDANKVILFAFRADSVNSDYTINATVKYHLR
tara:strand:- start:37 stop:837 length:801 start_codon:yes stop_codon:yes gene_type:complete